MSQEFESLRDYLLFKRLKDKQGVMTICCCSFVYAFCLSINFKKLLDMNGEGTEVLEDKIDFLVFDLLTSEQYQKYVAFCKESGYQIEEGGV